MAKAVRWQIPFVSSIEQTQYRIDIYDEQDGTWSGVTTLTGGPSPIVTDEDASDDFFAPIRTQTGNIEVCTAIPGGGTLRLEDILPENNIARPVRLVSIASDMSEKIEWQGFLSCQAYNQAYTDIPEIIQLPINSVLEAMDSVPVSTDRIGGVMSISNLVYHILKEIRIQCDLPCFTHINYSADDFSIFSQLIDSTVLFALKEYNHEYSTTYIVDGMSCKEALTRICTFMGWVAREMKTDVVLERLCSDLGMYREEIEDFYGNFHYSVSYNSPLTTGLSIFDPYWRGTNHQQSITQGAKSVEVVAKLAKYELHISIPETPSGSLTERYRQLWKYKEDGDWLYLLANTNTIAYSNMSVGYYSAECRYMYCYYDPDSYLASNISQVLLHMATGAMSSAKESLQGDQLGLYRWYAGAFLCRYDWEDTGDAVTHETADALYCVFFPHSLNEPTINSYQVTNFDISKVGPIFSINSVLDYRCDRGFFKLSANADTIFQLSSPDYLGAEFIHSSEKLYTWCIAMELRIGNKWWNGSEWQSTKCIFNAPMTKNGFKGNWEDSMKIAETDGLLIPITTNMQGLVTFSIYPMSSETTNGANSAPLEMIFNSLSVEHVMPDEYNLTDRSENHYFRLLGTNFRNEVSISTDLATTLNNTPSPSLILGHTLEPIKEITYYKDNGSDIAGATTEKRRPEIDLLNRLARYYQKARRKLNLIVRYAGTIPPKDRLVLRNDNKEYRPMAESCDWKNDTSDITFMEIPN